MTDPLSAGKAREIVEACRHGVGLTSQPNTTNAAQPAAACEACIAAALAAQAAQTRHPVERLSPLGGWRVQACSATCSHDLRCSELEAAQTRALRLALFALIHYVEHHVVESTPLTLEELEIDDEKECPALCSAKDVRAQTWDLVRAALTGAPREPA